MAGIYRATSLPNIYEYVTPRTVKGSDGVDVVVGENIRKIVKTDLEARIAKEQEDLDAINAL